MGILLSVKKSFLATAMLLFVVGVKAQVGNQVLEKIDQWQAYVKYPADYNQNTSKRYPAIIFMVGLGEVGTNAANLLKHGPAYFISRGHKMEFLVDGVLETPIVISLQPNSGWPNAFSVNRHVDSIMRRYRIDENRLAFTGLSMGGWAWENYINEALTYAQRPASIVTMSAPGPGGIFENLRHYALSGGWWWGFEGTTDYRALDKRRDILNSTVPGSARYTQYVGGHCCWNTWYNPDWKENGESIYEWMLRKKKVKPATNPVTNSKPSLNLPATISLPATATSTIVNPVVADADGWLVKADWKKISGPSSGNVVQPMHVATEIRSLVAGSYVFELSITDNAGAATTSRVQITVGNTVVIPNKAPLAKAPKDTSIVLPQSGLSLSATATDSDGTIASQSWRKLNGPASITLQNVNTSTVTAINLTAGTLQLEYAATDNGGSTARDTVNITILPQPNTPPKANAGIDIALQLPQNSTLLSGKNSTDIDGQIISYSWKKLSGGVAVVEQPSAMETMITQLAAGIYQFELQVTDNNNAIARDTVVLSVSPVNNIKPIANAGADITIEVPTTSVVLDAGASKDSDGSIIAYQWKQISGPSVSNIVNATSKTTMVSKLTEGTYHFILTVADNNNGTATDTVAVSVISQNALQRMPDSRNRILVDFGPQFFGGVRTSIDRWGKYWNTMEEGKNGVRLINAVDTANNISSIGIDVVGRIDGTFDVNGPGMNGGNTSIGEVGDYPASATVDNAFAHNSVANGRWRIFGLDPNTTYHFKFWGTRATTGRRTMQIKLAEESTYTKEFDAINNKNYNNAIFYNDITGVSEVIFDIRVKPGDQFGSLSVLDITSHSNSVATFTFSQQNATADEAKVKSILTQKETLVPIAVRSYPNPTSNQLTIDLSGKYVGPVQMILVDASGQNRMQVNAQKQTSQMRQTLQIGSLNHGMYMLRIVAGQTQLTEKVWKQ